MTAELVSVPILLEAELTVDSCDLEVDVSEDVGLEMDTSVVIHRIFEEEYEGEYHVVPSQEEQTLPTENRVLRRNVTVEGVQMSLATTAQINRLF